MATKTKEEIEELFTPLLREGEEFRWVGQPRYNFWRVNVFQLIQGFLTVVMVALVFLPFLIRRSEAFPLLFLSLGISLVLVIMTENYKARAGVFHLTYYAITNQRVAISEIGII